MTATAQRFNDTAPNFSPQQAKAMNMVGSWLSKKNSPQIFRLFGYAGTGKTTIARHLAETANGKVLFGAFTGKASLVLRSKDCAGASTIHSMIYSAKEDADGLYRFELNPASDVGKAALVVIDECSMVGDELANDLLSFGTKILVLGDPAQLPPVKGAGYFTEADPDMMLTEVHRQAKDSPIIHMATTVREGEKLSWGQYGESLVFSRKEITARQALGVDQVLCGLNRTRQSRNMRLRELNGITSQEPVINDRLVCLKNKRDAGLFNGSIWTVAEVEIDGDDFKMKIRPEDAGGVRAPVDVITHRCFFDGTAPDYHPNELKGYEQFDFGYALTVHKSQGSQWDSVLLQNESFAFRDDAKRWLYTGITRAAERIMVAM